MGNVIDKRSAPAHLSEICDLFTELAASASTTFFGAAYADQKERPRQGIIEPRACVHGVIKVDDERLVEAASVLRRLPRKRMQGYFSI